MLCAVNLVEFVFVFFGGGVCSGNDFQMRPCTVLLKLFQIDKTNLNSFDGLGMVI